MTKKKNLTVRQVRKLLDNAGFLPFEITAWTRTYRITPSGQKIKVAPIPLNVPYIRDMIKERARGYKAAKKAKLGIEEYINMITDDLYGRLELVDTDGNPDPWQYLRRQEDKYKDQNPEYQSPYKAKKPKTDFEGKYNAGKSRRRMTNLEKYEQGRGKGW